jgi:hypothetical protein
MEWNGMEWNRMEWNGMEWNGMECIHYHYNKTLFSKCLITVVYLR